jgi:hypothetical protein
MATSKKPSSEIEQLAAAILSEATSLPSSTSTSSTTPSSPSPPPSDTAAKRAKGRSKGSSKAASAVNTSEPPQDPKPPKPSNPPKVPRAPKKTPKSQRIPYNLEPSFLALSRAEQEQREYEIWLDLYMSDKAVLRKEFSKKNVMQKMLVHDPVKRGEVIIETTPFRGPLDPTTNEMDVTGDPDYIAVEHLRRTIKDKFGDVVDVISREKGIKEDKYFEIRFEGFEWELLFSRRKASFDKEWEGAKDVMQEGEIERILETVEWHVSDEAKYTYDMYPSSLVQ